MGRRLAAVTDARRGHDERGAGSDVAFLRDEPDSADGVTTGGWVPSPPAGDPGSPGPGPATERQGLGELQARALTSAMAAYTAAHGQPEPVPGSTPVRRWGMAGRVGVVAAVAIAVLGGLVVARSLQQTPTVVVPDAGPSAVAPAAPEVVVHVVGQVTEPGLVRLPEGSRVADAVAAAGGATEGADLATVNLARVLVDGEQVVVSRPGDQPGAGDQGGSTLLDLNAADAAALDGLPGVGPVIAQRIVDWRTSNGPFTVVDELAEVTGIGPAVLAGVRDLVRVG